MKSKPAHQAPEPAKKKKRRVWLYVIGGLLAIGIIANLVEPTADNKVPTASSAPYSVSGSSVVSETSFTPEPTLVPTSTPAETATPEPTPTLSPESSEPSQVIVYWTPNGGSYHSSENCRTLSRSKTILSGTVDEAVASGHGDPCGVCY